MAAGGEHIVRPVDQNGLDARGAELNAEIRVAAADVCCGAGLFLRHAMNLDS
ncbi:hypothetical protein SDC9_180569 [bioreactor metagenome]|uniref:Uncharacterized protein n=1 Tax=bioreactor metagenome TaxID=1076179 RepID=A0A645H3M0_9ZZZZ